MTQCVENTSLQIIYRDPRHPRRTYSEQGLSSTGTIKKSLLDGMDRHQGENYDSGTAHSSSGMQKGKMGERDS